MCLGGEGPRKVIQMLPGNVALVEGMRGTRETVSLAFVSGVVPGDYVSVAHGYAQERLDASDAMKVIRFFTRAIPDMTQKSLALSW